VAKAEWEVMPVPSGPSYLGRDSGNIECHWMSISEVTHGAKIYFCERRSAATRVARWLTEMVRFQSFHFCNQSSLLQGSS
jgi:hypothetical protein